MPTKPSLNLRRIASAAKRSHWPAVLAAGVSLFALASVATARHPTGIKKPTTYADVAVIFKTSCVGCHGGLKPAHGLNLMSYASIMKGDKAGKVVIAKKPRSSRLATVLHGKPEAMPPGKPLAKKQIAVIEAWIKAGAKQK